MRENAFCMVFHVRWISHHSSPNPTLVATRLGRDSETCGEKNPSHMENHTKCISYSLAVVHQLLKNRKQFIQYKNIKKSSTQMIPCGVPQGSILGPLLFILYTNDLPNSLTNSKVILFADDTTIYMSSTNIVQLYESINRDLDSLSEWFRANRLSLNISKTHYILFGQNPVKIPKTLSIKIMNEIIEHRQTVIC